MVSSSQDQVAGLTSDCLLEVEHVLMSNKGFLDHALLASPGHQNQVLTSTCSASSAAYSGRRTKSTLTNSSSASRKACPITESLLHIEFRQCAQLKGELDRNYVR